MRKGRLAITQLLALAAAALFLFTLLDVKRLTEAYPGASIRILDTAVKKKTLEKILEEGPSDDLRCTAAWSRSEPITAAAPSMQTTAQLRVVSVYGDMQQVAPMTLLSGGFPVEDDDLGCLLDAKSAEALFRSIDVVGVKVEANGRIYTVRGVIECDEAMLFMRSADAAYENLEFSVGDLAQSKADIDDFIYRHALSNDYVVIQNGMYARIMLGLSWVPIAVLLLAAALRLLQQARHVKKSGLGSLSLIIVSAVACGAGLVLLFQNAFYWPQTFLPTKCSDFAFWRELIDGWRQSRRELSMITPLSKDVLFYRGMRSCLWRIGAIILLEPYLCLRFERDGQCIRALITRSRTADRPQESRPLL